MKRVSLTCVLLLTGVTGALAQDDALDTDGDGLVSLTEVQAAYPEVTEQDFAQADGNADGQLNEDELSMAFMLGLLPANY